MSWGPCKHQRHEYAKRTEECLNYARNDCLYLNPIEDVPWNEHTQSYEYVSPEIVNDMPPVSTYNETNELDTDPDTDPREEGGRKYDTNKLRMDLIPPEALTSLGRILTFGAVKYDSRNWEKGMD
jgi:hypothetical protein